MAIRKLKRWIGKGLFALDQRFPAQERRRSDEAQAALDSATAHLILYQTETCPFCIRVRRAMQEMGITLATRDVHHSREYREELRQQGGRGRVPCLRIEEPSGELRWMYESSAIIGYLRENWAKE